MFTRLELSWRVGSLDKKRIIFFDSFLRLLMTFLIGWYCLDCLIMKERIIVSFVSCFFNKGRHGYNQAHISYTPLTSNHSFLDITFFILPWKQGDFVKRLKMWYLNVHCQKHRWQIRSLITCREILDVLLKEIFVFSVVNLLLFKDYSLRLKTKQFYLKIDKMK